MGKRYQISAKKTSEVFRKTNGKCFYCGELLPKDTEYLDWGGKVVSSHRNWHVEHVVPVSKGGGYDIGNLVPSCSQCNAEKGVS